MVAPVPVIVPTLAEPLRTPSTVHVTAVLDVFWTVAVNCCVPLGSTLTVLGVMPAAIGGGGVTVTAALADLVMSAVLVAVTV